MTISVVIPALDEAACVVSAVESAAGSGVEVIVVDGGSRDETARLARNAGARVFVACEGQRGRARQLRLGGKKSTGDVVLFLHADTRLAVGWRDAVECVMADPANAGGAFALRFDERGVRERWIEGWVAARVAVLRLPYGDQAIFLRRQLLERMGGVPVVPIMEDLDLVRAIKDAGELRSLALSATTSSRRYREGGTLRTLFWHSVALLGWYFGWDRTRLARRMGR
ncbi:MAG: glycosyltransferase family 2 protein [bacterium]|nr:glycosyltransferase family 2 protein [bacterium]